MMADGLWLLLALPLVAVVAVFAAQIALSPRWASVLAQAPIETAGSKPRPRIAVLVPAHNEAAGISESVLQLREQVGAGDVLLVIADNCHDNTAELARLAGAQVTQRDDPTRRGKAYALAHGMAWLEHHAAQPGVGRAFDVVVIVDADCECEPHALQAIALEAHARQQPVQALYLMHPPPGAALGQRIAGFAWRVRNGLRPLGWQRLGGACQLTGSGMALPWALAPLLAKGHGGIVEDMQLGMACAERGAPPWLLAAARVHSQFPAREAAARTQRTRWEHGHLAVLLAQGLPLLARGLARARWGMVSLALDLLVPPLVLLLLICLVAAVPAALLGALHMAPLWWVALMLSLPVIALAAIVWAWWRAGLDLVPPDEAWRAPSYVLTKLPLYAAFLKRRQQTWVRTARDDEPPNEGPKPP